MHYIYVDEAGTSEAEPVTVVVGLIVHADTQYERTEERLAKVLETVPAKLRRGFIPHAKTVWNDHSIRDVWSRESRVAFLKGMVSIHRNVGGIAMSVAFIRKYESGPHSDEWTADLRHRFAFALCIAHADAYIRKHISSREVVTVVAEDCPEKRVSLRAAASSFRNPVSLPLNDRGVPSSFQILRVKDGIHFASKQDSPFLQIADACAFAWRRYLSKQVLGEELVIEMLGSRNALEDNIDWGHANQGAFVLEPDLSRGRE